MKLLLAIVSFLALNAQTQAAPGVNGIEYKYVSGFVAHKYFDRAAANSAKHHPDFLNHMSKEEIAKWRAENESAIAPSASICDYVRYIENEVQPIGIDAIHALKNGSKFGNREESTLPFVKAQCTETTNPGYTSTYDCLLTFEYNQSAEFDVKVKRANTDVESYAPVVKLQSCLKPAGK